MKIIPNKIKTGEKSYINALVTVLMAAAIIFVSYPAMADAVYAGHDLWGLCGRIEGIKSAWDCGQIFPVIMPNANNGYGYLEFMYPELFLLIPAFLRKCGASMVLALHVYIFIINTATGVMCYFAVRSVLESFSGTVRDADIKIISLCASCFYLMSQYRLSDVYIRAAIGEAVSMAFLPFAIAGIYHILAGCRKKWWMAVIGMTGLLNSHILSSMLIIPVVLCFGIFYIRNIFTEKRWKEILISVISFFIVNAWYIIPFVRFYLFGLNTDALIFADIENHTVQVMQLFATSAKEAGQDYLLLTLGVVSFVTIIMTAVCAISKSGVAGAKTESGGSEMVENTVENTAENTSENNGKSRGKAASGLLGIVSAVFAVYLVFSLNLMPYVWVKTSKPGIMKILNMLQFPYRLLTICSVCLVFMLGISLLETKLFRDNLLTMTVLIIVLSLWGSGSLMSEYTSYTVGMVPSDTDFEQNVPDDYLPAGIDKSIFEDTSAVIDSPDGTIECVKNGTDIRITYNSNEDTTCSLPILYYPCFKAEDENGNDIEIFQCENKRMGLVLPAGEHSVRVRVKLY